MASFTLRKGMVVGMLEVVGMVVVVVGVVVVVVERMVELGLGQPS
jgi:hypothetical protein